LRNSAGLHAKWINKAIAKNKHGVYCSRMERIIKAISTAGGVSALAKELGATPQQVANWRVRGVPVEYCPAIERATNGAVRCEELRPEVDWSYLRGTAAVDAENTAKTDREAA
jgi:DNA-binding transcriptional regulator YdaS (Cro superfamily)